MSAITVIQLAYGEMAEPVLHSLINDVRYDVLSVVTPPADAALYRRESLLPQEKLAKDNKIEVFKITTLSELHDLVARLKPDLVLIASFNKIIPEQTLALSKFVNIHHGKLPRQRGRANINWAIINGEVSVSISVHEAVPELDAGGILHQYHLSIGPNDDIADIYSEINQILQEVLPDLLGEYMTGHLALQVQDHSRATYCCTRLPDDGMIDWSWPRVRIRNFVRALSKPFPGAFTYLGDQKLIIWKLREPDTPRNFEGIVPGRIVGIHKGQGVEVLAGDGPLLITDVEGVGVFGDPSQIIHSYKCTLGLSVQDLLHRLE
jgi:methionyl-tRNA formyltransferase